MPSSLDHPDDPGWHSDSRYSEDAAERLTRAYRLLAEGGRDTQSYLDAFALLAPLRDRDLPDHDQQRLRELYLRSMAYSADGAYDYALTSQGRAIELATDLRDESALTELFYLRGAVYRSLGNYDAAAQDYHAALLLLREHPEAGFLANPQFAVDIFAAVAGFDYMLAEFDLAAEQLREAEAIAMRVPVTRLQQATIAWIWSLLLRHSGERDIALRHAFVAAATYAELGNPISASRAHQVVADIALDLAASLAGGPADEGAASYFGIAAHYLRRAYALARRAKDPTSRAMADLVAIRRDWMLGRPQDHRARLLRVVRLAEHDKDDTLLAQAHIALGDERLAAGDAAIASEWYYTALATSERANIPVLALLARRAIHRARERLPDAGDDGKPPADD